MTRALVIGAALAMAGCSFINDWGSLTTDPNARRDGGGIDGGAMDGGGPDEDAGPSCTDACTPGDGVCTNPTFCGVGANGCTLCVECEACEACPDTCVYEPGSCYCDGELRPEGSTCEFDAECAENLGCLGGVCHRYCADPGLDPECESDSIIPHCVFFPESGVSHCVDEICDPLSPEPLECLALGFPECVVDAEGLTCANTGVGSLHQPCGGASDCGLGLSCLEFIGTDGLPRSFCVESCDLAGSAACSDFGECQGLDITLGDGVQLGVCVPRDEDADGFPPPYDCDDADFARGPGTAEECSDGTDNDCNFLIDLEDPECTRCEADADCAVTEACALEGQCRPRGEEGSSCFTDSTCLGDLQCVSAEFRCYYACANDADCAALGTTFGSCDPTLPACRYKRSGQTCTSGTECTSGTCGAGVCT